MDFLHSQYLRNMCNQQFVPLCRIDISAAVLSVYFLIRLITDGDTIKIKLLDSKIDIVPIDFIKVMCTAAINTDTMNSAAEQIAYKHRRDSALPI